MHAVHPRLGKLRRENSTLPPGTACPLAVLPLPVIFALMLSHLLSLLAGLTPHITSQHRPELGEDGIVQHLLYDDSIHPELPAERVPELLERNGVVHIELAPGDCVCWHDSLWHYSPPNVSERGRIGIAAVYTTPRQTDATAASGRNWPAETAWVMKAGERCLDYPPEVYTPQAGSSRTGGTEEVQQRQGQGPVPPPHAGERPSWDSSAVAAARL